MKGEKLSEREIFELYDEVMKTNLHHSTLIINHIPKLDSFQKEDRDNAECVIKREVNTIKRNLGRIYPFCSKKVKAVIDEISEKGTQICGLSSIYDFKRNVSAISMWASVIHDIRLNLTRRPWEFLSSVNIDISLIKIDFGPSLLDI